VLSAYIPTNVISITDGQIYLEPDLFNFGIRPALNIGISVSRVGGNAQIKAMKKISGPLRLELAAFRELAAFAKFGSDLDKVTLNKLKRGRILTQLLIQGQFQPLPIENQIAILYGATNNCLDAVDEEQIKRYEKEFHEFMQNMHKDLLNKIADEKVLSDEIKGLLMKAFDEFNKTFS